MVCPGQAWTHSGPFQSLPPHLQGLAWAEKTEEKEFSSSFWRGKMVAASVWGWAAGSLWGLSLWYREKGKVHLVCWKAGCLENCYYVLRIWAHFFEFWVFVKGDFFAPSFPPPAALFSPSYAALKGWNSVCYSKSTIICWVWVIFKWTSWIFRQNLKIRGLEKSNTRMQAVGSIWREEKTNFWMIFVDWNETGVICTHWGLGLMWWKVKYMLNQKSFWNIFPSLFNFLATIFPFFWSIKRSHFWKALFQMYLLKSSVSNVHLCGIDVK